MNGESAALAVGAVRRRTVQGLAMVEHDANGRQDDDDRFDIAEGVRRVEHGSDDDEAVAPEGVDLVLGPGVMGAVGGWLFHGEGGR